MGEERVYLCIDLKTFYASVECIDRGLDPFTSNLVVADLSRGDTTICLAISPAMKALGVRNRCRVFEIPPGIEYVAARPRMRHYMEVSASIYGIYLRYISPEDIHVYSIDECFIDATPYLTLYGTDAKGLANMLMDAVYRETGICATAGIGTNLFLAKVALDITAMHAPDHIGYLDEDEFKRSIWTHRPITDIWNIGPGIARRLEKYGVHDLFGVCWLDEEVLYREFGVNAEYLIDHAHGREPCTIKEIHEYVPQSTSLASGQVLTGTYTFDETLVVLREMVDGLALDLVDRGMVAGHISLAVGHARGEGEHAAAGADVFVGEHGVRPAGGRMGPHSGGSRKLAVRTSSFKVLMEEFERLYRDTVDPLRPIKRVNVGVGDLVPEEFGTVDLFTDLEATDKERRMQRAVLAVKDKFGKNALLKGTSFLPKATARERNEMVGGHHE